MKKTRIRYKRLFFFLACFLIVLGLLAYGILFIIQWILAAPKTESISSQPPSQYYLFVGTNHEGPPQADSLILVSVNPQRKKCMRFHCQAIQKSAGMTSRCFF